jgi:putative ABC transport system permease protein
MKKSPPNYALRFLAWFCPPELHESVEGDLLQEFEDDAHTLGFPRARRKFIWNVLRFFRPGIFLRNKFSAQLISTIMIGNYVKVASRNIAKRKLYSFINAFGLSIGIAFCMLIYLFIQDEKSFDQFHVNKDKIYRLEEKTYDTWQQDPSKPYNYSAYLPMPILQVVMDEVPEIEFGTHFKAFGDGSMQYGDKVFTERLTLVGKDFFKMFSFRLLQGSAEKVFLNKNEIVLTKEIARKYFGDDDPIGRIVTVFMEQERTMTVTGIIDAPPANSSLTYSVLVPIENDPGYERNRTQWGNFSYPTFVQLSPNANSSDLSAKFDTLVQKHMGERMESWRKRGNVPPEIKMFELQFTNLTDIHMKTNIGWHKVSDSKYSFILGGIAVLILLIASINYVSLALTTSTSRRVEVGIRKVVGAQRSQLLYQFGFESIALAVISMIIAAGLIFIFIPYFNDFTGKKIQVGVSNMIQFLGFGLLLTIVVGVLAGSYPSIFLSRFKPTSVLKGGFTSKLKAGFTKPLVVIQFALSAFLIISSVIMFRQMRFITTKDLGYNKEQLIAIPTQAGWSNESDAVVHQFRNRLSNEPSVISVTGTSSSFNKGYSRYGYTINDEQKSAYVYVVDPNYIPTVGVELIQGRNFRPGSSIDSTSLIVNEALVKDMGWKDPLNEHLNWTEDSTSLGAKIIGVVKDYNFLSLESGVEPMLLSMDKKNAGHMMEILIKINPSDIPATIETIRKNWKELYPNKAFDYSFVDEDVAKAYESHRRWMRIMGLATAFAILIACLGLFGLSGVNAVNRTKEIGIRKVMGAEMLNIFVLLNRQYVLLAIISFAIAAPLSWYVMNKWLSDFKFRITVSWELFAVSMLAGLGVALITVSYHAVRAALVNPSETLKYE